MCSDKSGAAANFAVPGGVAVALAADTTIENQGTAGAQKVVRAAHTRRGWDLLIRQSLGAADVQGPNLYASLNGPGLLLLARLEIPELTNYIVVGPSARNATVFVSVDGPLNFSSETSLFPLADYVVPGGSPSVLFQLPAQKNRVVYVATANIDHDGVRLLLGYMPIGAQP